MLDGVLYAVGGHDGPLVRKSVECYCPQSGVWTTTADMHTCRRNAGNCLFSPTNNNIDSSGVAIQVESGAYAPPVSKIHNIFGM